MRWSKAEETRGVESYLSEAMDYLDLIRLERQAVPKYFPEVASPAKRVSAWMGWETGTPSRNTSVFLQSGEPQAETHVV